MQFKTIKVRGLGPFATLVEHNITTLGGKLSVVSGANGAGKSTLLELLLGAVYRTTPTRGSLVALAGDNRDGLLEVVVETDRVYTLKHVVDGVSGKAEAVVSADGVALTTTGKVTEFDEFIAKHFPPLPIALTTQFAAQQSGGFLDAKPSERKALLLRMLGVDQLEQLALKGRERTRQARADQESAERVLAQTMGLNIPKTLAAAAALEECQTHKTWIDGEVLNTSVVLGEAQEFNRQAMVEQTARIEREKTAQRILADLELCRAEIARGAVTPEVEALLAQGTAIDQAQASLPGLIEYGQAFADQANTDQGIVDLATAELQTGRQAFAVVQNRHEQVKGLAAQFDQVIEAQSTINVAQRDAERFRKLHTAAVEELEAAQSQTLLDATGRIEGLRFGLNLCVESGNTEAAVDTLTADDEAVELAKALPGRIQAGRVATLGLAKQIAEAEGTERSALAMAAKNDSVMAARSEADSLAATLATQQQELIDTAQRLAEVTARAEASIADRNKARATYAAARDIAGMSDRLAKAREQQAAAGAKRAELQKRVLALDAEIEALPPAPNPVALKDIASLQTLADAAVGAASRAEAALALATKAVDDGKARDERAKQQHLESTTAQRVAEDWCRLSKDLGKDGLQAAVIDAALPELIAITNQLLGDAFGPRFAVDIRSQAVTASGKKMVETLDVVVIDSEHGREAKAETYSGGERAIIAEGLSLALTTLACRQSGITCPTIVRDEAGAALDEKRGREWVAMLRQAAELIGASRVLFVSHDPGCRALADSEVAL